MLHDELCRHWQLKGLQCPLHNSELIQIRAGTIASYPGLLTPAFVACSTNALESLVNSSTSPGTSCQAFPYVSTTSEKCLNEKAWVRAYRDRSCLLASFKVQNLESNSNTVPANSMLSSVNNRAGYPVWNVENTHLGTQFTVGDTRSVVLDMVKGQETTHTLISLSLIFFIQWI